jgi:hypothetical protein
MAATSPLSQLSHVVGALNCPPLVYDNQKVWSPIPMPSDGATIVTHRNTRARRAIGSVESAIDLLIVVHMHGLDMV